MAVKENPSLEVPQSVAKVRSLQTVAGQVTSERGAEENSAFERELTEEEVARVEMVKKIMFDLMKTVRSYSIYNQNNEAIRQFIQNLYDSIKNFLKNEEGILSLRIKPESIFYMEQLIYENANPDESIAIKLHKDGIKEIVFQEGLEKKELVDFIEILNINLDSPEFFDQDVVSLMWERDFDNISYFVIEGFSDNIEPARREKIEEDIDLILSLVHSDRPPERALKSARLSKEDLYNYFKQESLEENKAQALQDQDAFKSKFIVSDEEVRRIRDEMDKISDAEMIFQMVEIIINLLMKETDQDSFVAIGEVLVQVLDMMLLRADFSNATRIVKRLREMVISGGIKHGKDEEEMVVQGNLVPRDFHQNVRMSSGVDEILNHLGQEQRLEQVVTALNQGYKGKPTDIFDFLISLNANAVTPLLNLLGDVSKITHRRLVCDAILIIHDGDVSLFARKLYDERWFVVSDMLYILGKVGHSDALTYMMKAFQHENPKVRGEALAALRRFPIDKVRPVFIEALRDSNLQVQLNALRTLAYYRDHSAVDEILGVIESKDFFDYPLNVKKRFYVTLANIEGTAVVSYLVKVLRKNRFWLGSINTDIRISAAHALGTIGSPDTLKVLNRFSKNWNRSLRMACKEALQHQKTGQSSGGGLMLEPLDTQMVQNKRKGDDIILEPLND